MGAFLLYTFHNSPDSKFPCGRLPADCFAYIIIITGIAFLLRFRRERPVGLRRPAHRLFIIAIVFTLFTGILFAVLVSRHDASLVICMGSLRYKTGDTLAESFSPPAP